MRIVFEPFRMIRRSGLMCSSKKSRLTPSIEAASVGITVTRGSALFFGLPLGSGTGAADRSKLSCSSDMLGTYMIRLMIATRGSRLPV